MMAHTMYQNVNGHPMYQNVNQPSCSSAVEPFNINNLNRFEDFVSRQVLPTGMQSNGNTQSGRVVNLQEIYQQWHPYSFDRRVHPICPPYFHYNIPEQMKSQEPFMRAMPANETARASSTQQQQDGNCNEVVSSTVSPVQQVTEPASSEDFKEAENPTEKQTNCTKAPPKKRVRTAYSSDQIVKLEQEFLITNFICRPKRILLSNQLNIPEEKIKIWFQNRRMKKKKSEQEGFQIPQKQQPSNSKPKNISSVSVSHHNAAGILSHRTPISAVDIPSSSSNSNNPLQHMQSQGVITPPSSFTPSSTSSGESSYYQNMINNQIQNTPIGNNYDMGSSYGNNIGYMQYNQQQYNTSNHQNNNQLSNNYYNNQYYDYQQNQTLYQEIPYQNNPVNEVGFYNTHEGSSEASTSNYNVPVQVSHCSSNTFL